MRDYLIKGSSPTLRFALVGCTAAAEAARAAWGVTNPPAARLLAKALASAALLAAFLKGEERVHLHWACASAAAPVSEVYAEALPIGEVRGYIRGSALALGSSPSGWDGCIPTSAPGGCLSVGRVLYGARAVQRTTVELARGDIDSELAHYYVQSEQRPAQVRLDAAVEASSARVAWCAGMLVEALPQEGGSGAGPGGGGDSFAALAERLRGAEPWPPGLGAREAAAALAPTLQWGKRVPLDFFCRCTAAGFLDKLLGSCSRELLDQMLAEAVDGVAATLVCSFCNRSHAITCPELQRKLV